MLKNIISNRILLIAILLISFFGMNLQEGKGQPPCPTGYSSMTVTINTRGCNYLVDICYKCSPIGGVPGSVSIIGFKKIPTTPPCIQNPPITDLQALDYIKTHIQSPTFYNEYLCISSLEIPPCPDKSEQLDYHHYYCWKVEMVSYMGVPTLYYRVCNTDSWCYYNFKWCYDAQTNSIIKYFMVRTSQNQPDCLGIEAWDVTLPSNVGESSDCFIIHNDCY